MSKTKSKSKLAKPVVKKAAPAKAATVRQVYRICEAVEGRQVVGEAKSADEAARMAAAYSAEKRVAVEVARGRVTGSRFTAEFTEIIQPPAPVAELEVQADVEVPADEPATTAPVEAEPVGEAPIVDDAPVEADGEPIAEATNIEPALDAIVAATPVDAPGESAPIAETAKPAKVKPARKPKADRPRKMSALDAAAKVLAHAGRDLNTVEMIALMQAQALWESPNGRTPSATLSSAIIREITTKGSDSRFKKVAPGRYAAA